MGEYLKRFQSAADYTAHINSTETSPLNVSICDDNNEMHYMEQGNSSKIAPSIDSNIVPGNIKKDVTILGVTGTYEGEGGEILSTVNVNLPANELGIVYYVNANKNIENINTEEPGPYGGDNIITCLCDSMLIYLYKSPQEPGTSDYLQNCTLINTQTISGRSTNYTRISFFKVNNNI